MDDQQQHHGDPDDQHHQGSQDGCVFGVEPPGTKCRPKAITTPIRKVSGDTSPKFIFWAAEQTPPASLLCMLLRRAGDVKTNPGPRWYCSVCLSEIRPSSISVKCNTCLGWCHLRPCSTLRSHLAWSQTFVAPCCTQPAPTRTPPPIPTPTPLPLPSPTRSPHINRNNDHLRLLQWNCNSLASQILETTHFMTTQNIIVAAIQESKLSPRSSLQMKDGYTVVRQDRTIRGGGPQVHKSIEYALATLPLPPATDTHLEQLAIQIRIADTYVTIVNFYIPPSSSCAAGYKASLLHLLDLEDCILMGDANAHNSM